MKDLLAPIIASAKIIKDAQAIIDAEIPVRDKAIAKARVDGYPWVKLREAAELSRQGVEVAGRRGNKGQLPVPRHQK